MNPEHNLKVIEQHCKTFFKGHKCTSHQWKAGPIQEIALWLRVLEFAPGPTIGLWVYISVGASLLGSNDDSGIEFIIVSPKSDSRIIELMAMNAYYHNNHSLGLGHTVPIGEPWLDKSTCDHLLVSLPYPFGPKLEICNIENGHIHLFWLLPITKAERDFKASNGLEDLEQKFDSLGLEYWVVDRASAI